MVALRSVLSGVTLGALYQMMKNLSHERPQLEIRTNYIKDEREAASCDGREARSAPFVC
jgi:hypothetical protein